MEDRKRDISMLVDHFFRHESGKMVSVLTKIFGSQNVDLAEDVVQDSLIEAMEYWQYHDVPDNPSAWLFRVAKNKALNIIHREKYKLQYSNEAAYLLRSGEQPEPADPFSEQEIQDDQLRMIFTCCHPSISADSQIALSLKTLCGFSIPEIARAFLTTETNINKRLVRARQTIRDEKIPFEVPKGKDLELRMRAVLETIYLLFNEAYSATKGNDIIRFELCQEAIRLAQMLENENTIKQKGDIYALLSLMFLNTSRFRARQDQEGNLLTMGEQNRLLWDRKLQASGFEYLQKATENTVTGTYYILAAISANYCLAPDYNSTNWENILALYDCLVEMDHSPVVLLNRAIVLSKITGAQKGLHELERIKNEPQIKTYHLFHSTQAEFFIELGEFEMAISSLIVAAKWAPLESIRALLKKKISYCKKKIRCDSSF